MSDDPPPKILDLRTVHRGFTHFMLARVRLADGEVLIREIEDRGDAVGVLPYDPARRTALTIRLFRVPLLYRALEPELQEAPAGMIDPGETAEAAARREAVEETGVTLGALDHVATVWSSPGVLTERVSLFLASCSLRERSGGGGKEGEHENITVLETPLAELGRSADAGEVEDMKLLILLQALRLRRPDLFL